VHKLYIDEYEKSAEEPVSLRAFEIFSQNNTSCIVATEVWTHVYCDEWAMKIEATGISDESSRLRGEHGLHLWKAQLPQEKIK